MTMNWLRVVGLMVGLLGISALDAQPVKADLNPAPRRDFASPERFGLELRGGPYTPSSTEGILDDEGPLLALEFDIWAWRIPYVGLIGGSVYAGWGNFSGKGGASEDGSPSTDEETKLVMFPLASMVVLRVDALVRQWGIPFVFTGKIGPELAFWSTSHGEVDDANDISWGLRWAAQVALELDFLERRAARALDEEWGINHTYLFFELYGSTTGKSPDTALEVGDSLTWATGLGFIF